MMKRIQKLTITKKEILSRIVLFFMALLLAYSSGDYNKQVLSMIGLLITFIISLYMHKHFFPLFIGAIACWLIASSQELYSAKYVYLESTRIFWTLGNILLPLGVADFIYRLIFKYKIVENEETNFV